MGQAAADPAASVVVRLGEADLEDPAALVALVALVVLEDLGRRQNRSLPSRLDCCGPGSIKGPNRGVFWTGFQPLLASGSISIKR